MPDPLAIISAALWPPRRLAMEDTLDGLGLGLVDRVCLACDLDEAFGMELPDATIDAWRTIADVVASVTAATGQAA
jgi:acyl carrier protein